jgi:hypothetical protein
VTLAFLSPISPLFRIRQSKRLLTTKRMCNVQREMVFDFKISGTFHFLIRGLSLIFKKVFREAKLRIDELLAFMSVSCLMQHAIQTSISLIFHCNIQPSVLS